MHNVSNKLNIYIFRAIIDRCRFVLNDFLFHRYFFYHVAPAVKLIYLLLFNSVLTYRNTSTKHKNQFVCGLEQNLIGAVGGLFNKLVEYRFDNVLLSMDLSQNISELLLDTSISKHHKTGSGRNWSDFK